MEQDMWTHSEHLLFLTKSVRLIISLWYFFVVVFSKLVFIFWARVCLSIIYYDIRYCLSSNCIFCLMPSSTRIKKIIRLQYGSHQPFSYEKFGDIKRAIRVRNMKKKKKKEEGRRKKKKKKKNRQCNWQKKKDLWTKHYSQNIAKKK